MHREEILVRVRCSQLNIFQGTLMVRGLTVNQVYGVKAYGGSSPPFGAKLLGCRQVVCQHAVNVPDFSGGSNPSFPAKITECSAVG